MRWLVLALLGLAIALLLALPMSQPTLGAESQSLPVPARVDVTEGDRWFQMGIDQYQAHDFEQAIASWQQALEIYQQISHTAQIQATVSNLGAVSLALGNYAEAVTWLEIALDYARQEENSLAQARTLGNLVIAHRSLGHYDRAIAVSQAALQIMRDLGNRSGEEQVLSNLGNVYERIGDYDRAIATYQQGLTLARALGDRQAEGIILSNLGGVYAAQGDHDRAIATYLSSLAIAQSIHDVAGEAHTRLNLGSAYFITHQDALALDYYQQSLSLAQALGDRPLESRVLNALGMAMAAVADYERAIVYQERSVAIARVVSDVKELAAGLNNLGHSLFDAGRLPEAEAHLREAIALWDQLRDNNRMNDLYAISVFDTQVFSYNLLQQVLVEQGKIGEALEISEQGRSRAMSAILADRQTQEGDRSLDVGGAESTLFTLGDIRRTAQTHKATIVEYSIIPDDSFRFQGKQRGREQELFIWVIQPTGELSFHRVDLSSLWSERYPTLANLVEFARQRLGARSEAAPSPTNAAPNTRFIAAQLRQLHALLIEPIADDLPTDPSDRIVIIPHESLFLVPFAALQDSDGRYVLEQHTLLTAPSIQVLALASDSSHLSDQSPPWSVDHPASSLVVGNPTMPMVRSPRSEPYQLAPLPGSEQEAIAIAAFLNTQPLIGEAATASAVLERLPQARLIHLATHGLLSYVEYDAPSSSLDPLASVSTSLRSPGAIALAPSDDHNGLLTAEDIRQQRLNADLVVLSACDTGRGQITGDGVVGLSRSFLVAGAETLVVTLWAVPDAATAFLMTEFYQHLQHGFDKPTALRLAMLASLDNYQQPLEWGAFTLIGAP
ncbi:MAG TPA: CHAT domain-containing tetratricopeptide repeat protein [Candidatus Obscuribacterales bacterium]